MPEREQPPGTLWQQPAMQAALEGRDITAVYRLLCRAGISQRRIAALTDQAQSEVSDIRKGRAVQSYALLTRIADGLGIPRGLMGLGYSPEATGGEEEDEAVKRRRFLAAAASAVVGTTIDFGWAPSIAQADPAAVTPTPARISLGDVHQVSDAIQALRIESERHGGPFARDAILAQVNWCRQLLGADCADYVRNRLLSVTANAHALAGWVSYDTGLINSARYHHQHALELTREARDFSWMAMVLNNAGRIERKSGQPGEALKLFEFGVLAAEQASDIPGRAVLTAEQAQAYSMLNLPSRATTALNNARRDCDRVASAKKTHVDWGLDECYLTTAAGWVALTQPSGDPQRAIPLLERSDRLRTAGDHRQRTSASRHITTATAYLRAGDFKHGLAKATHALETSSKLRSRIVNDHLTLLRTEAAKRSDSDCRQLANEIGRFLAKR